MKLKPWLSVGLAELTALTINQIDTIPETLLIILTNLPVVALVVWLQLHNQKWLEHMLEVERESIRSTYERSNNFVSSLIDQIQVKQNEMSDLIKELTMAVEMLRGTASEVAKVDDIVDRLLAEIRKDNG